MDCSHKACLLVSATKNNHTDSDLEVCEVTVHELFTVTKKHRFYDFVFTHCTPDSDFKLMQRKLMKCMGTFQYTRICYSLYISIYVNHSPCLIWEKHKLLTKKSCGYQFLKQYWLLASQWQRKELLYGCNLYECSFKSYVLWAKALAPHMEYPTRTNTCT